ncbi:MAG: Smr/MutS family protein, partial [Bacteroidaceae bacterium]|nr:Smr/MutS family protein [Bacteroidaceae bacterium]
LGRTYDLDSPPGVVNGAMLYDRQRMEALFQLQVGSPGSSFAVEIARKTGIPEDVIRDATELVGQNYVNADKYLLDISRDKRYWEGKRQTIHSREKQVEQVIARYESELAELQQRRKEILREAKEQAQQIIRQSNALVENTIREIREAQAERERTKSARQELDAYRQQLEQEQQQEQDALIAKKMRQIEERRKRKAERKKDSAQQPAANSQPPKANGPEALDVGDYVRLKGQTSVGRIEALQGKKATVVFGMMRTVVEADRLVAAQKPKETLGNEVPTVSRQTQELTRQRNLNFKQEIDVRGMRGDEALQAVTYYVDDAILVGCARVRILHGTGNGILRQLIRQYLQTVPAVRSAHDEHVQFGGAGVTVVELE